MFTFSFSLFFFGSALGCLPCVQAVHLDQCLGSPTRKPTFLFHTDQPMVRGDFVQPGFLAKPVPQPDGKIILGRVGLWSSDSLFGGICRYPISLFRRIRGR